MIEASTNTKAAFRARPNLESRRRRNSWRPMNLVETSIGARFERTEIRMYHGRKYFIGDSVTSQGERLFRTVACEKMVHSPTVMFAELVWEHIGRFARDMKTGELIRL